MHSDPSVSIERKEYSQIFDVEKAPYKSGVQLNRSIVMQN